MPLLQVVGSPLPASGKVLTTSTRLAILYMYAYADDDELYPIRYDASYDPVHNRWKPLGTPNGTIFYIPGPEANERFPRVSVHEFHVHADGTSQDFYREQVIIQQSEPGIWNYATSTEPLLVSNAVEVAWLRLQVPLGV